jgi:predicted dehydrogenase
MSWRYRGGPGSGALADLGSHLTDVAEFMLGPIDSVRGAALTTVIADRPVPLGPVVGHAHAEVTDERERVENDDWASYAVHFANGATGNLSASRPPELVEVRGLLRAGRAGVRCEPTG